MQRPVSASPGSESDSDWDVSGKNSTGNQVTRKRKRTKKVCFQQVCTFCEGYHEFVSQMSRSSSESNSDESEDDSDDNDASKDAIGNGGPSSAPQAAPIAVPAAITTTRKPLEESAKSDAEEGEVSSQGSDDDDDSDSSSDSEFNDGFDDCLMGDSDDRARLEGLSEKERETEIFKRIERRDVMRTRWEIERKLRQAKKAERDKDKTVTPAEKKKKEERKRRKKRAKIAAAAAAAARPAVKEMPPPSVLPPIQKFSVPAEQWKEEMKPPFSGTQSTTASSTSFAMPLDDEAENWDDEPNFVDPKERSKERKKTVEANKTDDKRSNAMALLKAKREGKLKRGMYTLLCRNAF